MEKRGLLEELGMMLHEGLSISEISRRLDERGYEDHRLILTGYLRALTDLGILVEEDVPPSKIYRYSSKRYDDVYGLMRKVLQPYDGVERLEVAVHLLTRLFNRPVFREELRRTGITEYTSPAVQEAGDEEVNLLARLRQILSIPGDDTALKLDTTVRLRVEPKVTEALLEALRLSLDLKDIILTYQEQTRLIET